jgi:hypothetical protein
MEKPSQNTEDASYIFDYIEACLNSKPTEGQREVVTPKTSSDHKVINAFSFVKTSYQGGRTNIKNKKHKPQYIIDKKKMITKEESFEFSKTYKSFIFSVYLYNIDGKLEEETIYRPHSCTDNVFRPCIQLKLIYRDGKKIRINYLNNKIKTERHFDDKGDRIQMVQYDNDGKKKRTIIYQNDGKHITKKHKPEGIKSFDHGTRGITELPLSIKEDLPDPRPRKRRKIGDTPSPPPSEQSQYYAIGNSMNTPKKLPELNKILNGITELPSKGSILPPIGSSFTLGRAPLPTNFNQRRGGRGGIGGRGGRGGIE